MIYDYTSFITLMRFFFSLLCNITEDNISVIEIDHAGFNLIGLLSKFLSGKEKIIEMMH